jgi:hypothetical protein
MGISMTHFFSYVPDKNSWHPICCPALSPHYLRIADHGMDKKSGVKNQKKEISPFYPSKKT